MELFNTLFKFEHWVLRYNGGSKVRNRINISCITEMPIYIGYTNRPTSVVHPAGAKPAEPSKK